MAYGQRLGENNGLEILMTQPDIGTVILTADKSEVLARLSSEADYCPKITVLGYRDSEPPIEFDFPVRFGRRLAYYLAAEMNKQDGTDCSVFAHLMNGLHPKSGSGSLQGWNLSPKNVSVFDKLQFGHTLLFTDKDLTKPNEGFAPHWVVCLGDGYCISKMGYQKNDSLVIAPIDIVQNTYGYEHVYQATPQ